MPIQDSPPMIVLDTNVVLDWMVFKNPSVRGIASEVCARTLIWIASAEMKSELEHVMNRGLGARWPEESARLWADWEAHATDRALPLSRPPATWPRCTDADDQKFIDLALAHQARWLITRDRAVLKTAKRCRPLGLEIMTPEQWPGEPRP